MDFEAIIIKDQVRNNLHISWDDEDGFVFLVHAGHEKYG